MRIGTQRESSTRGGGGERELEWREQSSQLFSESYFTIYFHMFLDLLFGHGPKN